MTTEQAAPTAEPPATTVADLKKQPATDAPAADPPAAADAPAPAADADANAPADASAPDAPAADAPAAEAPVADAPAAEDDAEDEAANADDSWYGKGPPDELVARIKEKLSDDVVALYVKAVRQYSGAVSAADPSVPRLLQSTSTFVKALKAVPEDLQMTPAFGELSLAYGRALVRYVEVEGTGSTAVTAKIVKTLQSAIAGAARSVATEEGVDPPADEKAEEQKADAEGGKKTDGEKDAEKKDQGEIKADTKDAEKPAGKEDEEEEEEDDGDNEEELRNAWTQLEVARVIFSNHELTEREGECRYTLGELLMACDEGPQAGAEFATAVGLIGGGARAQAECCYKQYLAVRNADRAQGQKALARGVELLATCGDSVATELTDMRAELKELEETMAEEEKKGATGDVPTEVQVVRPKRKRDEKKENGDAATADATNGDTATDAGNGQTEATKEDSVVREEKKAKLSDEVKA